MNDYLLQVKSTIDKTMNDIRTSLLGDFPDLLAGDVDNLVESDSIFKSPDPAIIWQFLMLTPAPRDPMYRVEFLVGVKTVADASSYVMSSLSNELRQSFEIGSRIEVGDYSGATAVPNTGYMVVTDNAYAPQRYDNMAGIRFFTITAKGARLIS